jgi:crossover junction endodeoxyribonuclease RusA
MTARAWLIPLPIESPPLRDNQRLHWADKARKTRQLRSYASLLARRYKVPRLDRARIVLHWQPATVRRRDQLSIAPTLKPLVDGLIDAQVLPDDDSEHAELSCRIEPVAEKAALWLVITAIEGELQ